MSIDKLAQKRELREKATEFFDMNTSALSLFDKEFSNFMKMLKSTDDAARTKATNLKGYLARCKTLMNGHDYIGCASELAQYYDELDAIMLSFEVLDNTLLDESHKVLVDHLDDQTKKYLRDRHRRTKPKTAGANNELTKVASVLDWFKNKLSTRRKAVLALEKRFPKIVELKRNLNQSLLAAEKLHINVLGYFKMLSKARAKGDIGSYQKFINEFDQTIVSEKKNFDVFFNTSMEPYIKYIDKVLAVNAPAESWTNAATPGRFQFGPKGEPGSASSVVPSPDLEDFRKPFMAAKPAPESEIPSETEASPAPVTTTPVETDHQISLPLQGPGINPSMLELSKNMQRPLAAPAAPVSAPAKATGTDGAAGRKDPGGKPLPLRPPGKKADHEAFINKVSSMSENDMRAIAQEILTYSESLEESDPVASVKLLAIVENLLN